MKRMFQIIGMISLICVSFFLTEKTVDVVKDTDQIMIKIKEKRDELVELPIDAVMKEDTIIPGISGKTVDIKKSYEKMKRYGDYLDSLLEFKKVSPNVSLSNHYDKYVIGGNPKKNMVSLLFIVKEDTDIEPFLKKLEKTNTKVTFFLDGNWFENHNAKVLELMDQGYEIGNYSIQNNYQDSSFVWMDTIIKKLGKQKQSYCYMEEKKEDDLMICMMNKDYTIMPNIRIQNYPLKEIKEQLQAGSIISLPMNQKVLEELSSIISYIESKGYTIELLKTHLEE